MLAMNPGPGCLGGKNGIINSCSLQVHGVGAFAALKLLEASAAEPAPNANDDQ